MRAWRECADDVRAGAAKWEQRWEQCKSEQVGLDTLIRCGCGWASTSRAAAWRHKQQHSESTATSRRHVMSGPEPLHMTLAKRLTLSGPTHYLSETGWRVRMVLAWQRLVRAEKVRKKRRRAPMWREAERGRISRLAERQSMEVRRSEGEWMAETGRERGVRYEWRLQEETARDMNVTSGAAAVLAKRRRADSEHAHNNSPSQRTRTEGGGNQEATSAKEERCKRRHGEDGAGTEDVGRKRRRDAFGDG